MSKNRLVLIDGYNFLFRAYYAIRHLTRSDGLPTGALFGFTRMLMNILVDIHSTHMAVVFDTGKKNFRHKIYPKYKANRPPAPEDLVPQFPLAREAVEALNVHILEKVGYEADDVIATLAARAAAKDFEVLIISSDKDLMQLVDSKISVYDAMKNKKIGINEVKEKWGVEPKKVLDILALTGDSSDNVPGVPGIGPKTALLLINKYGDTEGVIKNVDDIKQNKRRESIRENVENIRLSKQLINLDKNVDLGISVKDLATKDLHPETFLQFLKVHEFNSIAKKVEKAFGVKAEDIKEPDLFRDHVKKPKQSKDPLTPKKYKTTSKSVHKQITDLKELDEIIAKAEYDGKLFMDILTDKIEFNSKVLSIVLSPGENIYCVNVKDGKKQSENLDLFSSDSNQKDSLNSFDIKEILKKLKNILNDESVLKIGYDVKKQIKILNGYDVKIQSFEDVSVISYIVSAGLHSQNLSTIIYENLIRKKSKNQWHLPLEYKQMSIEAKTELLKDYEKGKTLTDLTKKQFEISCFYVEAVKELYAILKQEIYNKKLSSIYETFERPLTAILADMEITGVNVNIVELKKLSEDFTKKIAKLEKEIYKLADTEFNIGSPKQLNEILFQKMKIPAKKKSAKSGWYSTKSDILEQLGADGHKIATKILEWRHFSKLKTTYTDALPKIINKKTGRIHTTFSNITAATGRLSSVNPNLQNIPIRTEEGTKIRKAFVAKKGCKLVSADYSQVELRVLANYANVKNLIRDFNDKKDVHKTTAAKVFNVEENGVTKDMRRTAKAINFSIVYGTTAYGLAKRINSSNKEAKQYIENYFKVYPEIAEYMENSKEFAKKNGYVESMFGRRCHINLNVKGAQRGFAERLAINAPMQGTAADIIKKAMIDLHEKLKKSGSKAKIILQVHDELILEAPESEAEKTAKLLKEIMEKAFIFKVPLDVEVSVGKNWAEIH